MRSLFIFISFLFLVGCSVTAPATIEYRVNPELEVQKDLKNSCKKSTLKIAKVFSPNSLMTKSMKYAGPNYEISSFTESKWSSSPNKAISDALIRSVRSSNSFATVSGYRSRAHTDLLLETNIESFIQYFDKENNQSYVDVSLSYSLVDLRTGKAFKSRIVRKKQTTESADAIGGVKALNLALKNVLFETNVWLSSSCK